jgi:hypothetical protein
MRPTAGSSRAKLRIALIPIVMLTLPGWSDRLIWRNEVTASPILATGVTAHTSAKIITEILTQKGGMSRPSHKSGRAVDAKEVGERVDTSRLVYIKNDVLSAVTTKIRLQFAV